MKSRLLSESISFDFESELISPALRTFIATYLDRHVTSLAPDYRVLITTGLVADPRYQYQIIIGERPMSVEAQGAGLAVYLAHHQVEGLLPAVLELINERVVQAQQQQFKVWADLGLKETKTSAWSKDSQDREFLAQATELIQRNLSVHELKNELNQLPAMQAAHVAVCTPADLASFKNTKVTKVLPIYCSSEAQIFWGLVQLDGGRIDDRIFWELLAQLHDYLEVLARIAIETKRFELFESGIQQLPTALVLVDEKANIRLHNQAFLELGMAMGNLTALSDQEFLRSGEHSYQVSIHPFTLDQERFRIFLFEKLQTSTESSAGGNEELGIISSSLAHELNNPLAGILASLSVIELEDEEGRLAGQLQEMKKGVQRCKQLVETFLGFSKSQPLERAPSAGPVFQSGLNQALELMRFRMIENNININLSYNQRRPLSVALDFPVMVMLNYLLLGELTTALSHYNLLTQGNAKSIELEILESGQEIALRWQPDFTLSSAFVESRLFLHLLETQRLQFEVDGKGLVLSTISDEAESSIHPL